MKPNWLLIIALLCTGAIAVWGVMDAAGLAEVAAAIVAEQFGARGWFIMLNATFMLLISGYLMFSKYGNIKLGGEFDQPEFSTISWLSMLFAAGMGVGLLFYAAAEPLTHYRFFEDKEAQQSANGALFVTNFHWGLHAWAIYAMTGLVIAYFSFRKSLPTLVGASIPAVLGENKLTLSVAWLCNLLAIVAIAIGLAGSVALGVFQVQQGVNQLAGWEYSGMQTTLTIFVVLCVAFTLPLLVDLSKGMAVLSNIAMSIAVLLMIFVLVTGPTSYLMGSTFQSIGDYFGNVVQHGFRTFTFMDESINNWFSDWTLNYMVWWLAWAPFVGVFIARISRGRTIREYLIGVIFVPTMFSIVWFGIFGGVGFFGVLRTDLPLLEIVSTNIDAVTFFVLQQFPLTTLTTALVVVAAFLFVVTSVVSAAFVLAMFSTNGNLEPSVKVKLSWGAVLGALGLVMILSGSVSSVRSIIAVGALPFVFITLLLVVCLLKSLKQEESE